MNNRESIIKLLERDPLTNLTLLKMLDAYGDRMETFLVASGEQWGVLLLLPTEASHYDRITYPGASHVVFMEYTDDALFPLLTEKLPADGRLVFKLQRPAYAARLSESRPMERVRGFISFTSSEGAVFKPCEDAVLGYAYEEEPGRLWLANGYSRSDINAYFRSGAFSCSLKLNGEYASTCLAFPNYRNIWEIGALHTHDKFLRQGLARKAVETALHHIIRLGRKPRYHVLETNGPSIRLAESAGLVPFMALEHYVSFVS